MVAPDLVEYLVVVAPDAPSLAGTVEALTELLASETIRLLDLVVLIKDPDGGAQVVEIEAVPELALLAAIDRDAPGLLTNQDMELVSVAVRPGQAGMVLVAEDRWAAPLSEALADVGGWIVAGERIARARVLSVLAAEGADIDRREEP